MDPGRDKGVAHSDGSGEDVMLGHGVELLYYRIKGLREDTLGQIWIVRRMVSDPAKQLGLISENTASRTGASWIVAVHIDNRTSWVVFTHKGGS